MLWQSETALFSSKPRIDMNVNTSKNELIPAAPTGKPKECRARFPKTTGQEKALAELAVMPSSTGALVVEGYGKRMFGDIKAGAIAEAIETSVAKIKSNDMSEVEAMLISQAHGLQAMFSHMANRALNQQNLSSIESFFRMAVKAQNQCRMTLETLSTIKNPPVIYAKQANISSGPQQVNNGLLAPAREEKTISSNKLLEHQHEQRLDTGTAGAAIGADKELATMGEIDRAKDG